MPSRLAVLIVADLVDYSRLMGEDEAMTIGAIRELKDTHLEPKMIADGGEILKRMGDGWIIAFPSVTAALQSAMDVQTALAPHPIIKLRMGVHMGEIVEDEDDFYGAAVNLAQRLQTESPPGGVMISQDLHRQLTGDMAKAFSDAGSFKLKNIALPVNGFQWRPQPGPSSNAGEVPTICVEPISFAPADEDVAAAAADLRDQLIFRLSKRTGVRVLDEASSNANQSVYVLRARLRISGERGRLNIALVVRESGETVWNQSYDGDPTDIFAFTDDLIDKSIAGLRIQINAFDDNRIANLPDDQLSLSELRSRAAASFYQCSLESWERAHAILERALRLNPDDPMALSMRAMATIFVTSARFDPMAESQVERLAADLNQAVELSPRSDYVFSARAFFKVLSIRDPSGAIPDADRALSLNPSYHLAYNARGLAKLLAGDTTGAIADLEKAISLGESDPLLPIWLFSLSIAQHIAGRDRDAIEMIERAIQLRPNQWNYYVLLAICRRSLGDEAGASEAEVQASQLPREPSIFALLPALPEEYGDLVAQVSPQ